LTAEDIFSQYKEATRLPVGSLVATIAIRVLVVIGAPLSGAIHVTEQGCAVFCALPTITRISRDEK